MDAGCILSIPSHLATKFDSIHIVCIAQCTDYLIRWTGTSFLAHMYM